MTRLHRATQGLAITSMVAVFALALWRRYPVSLGDVGLAIVVATAFRLILGLVIARLVRPAVTCLAEAVGEPKDIVTLVHGTFARGAAWTLADAPLPRMLLADTRVSRSLYSLEWSGENCHLARARAARALRRHIIDQAERSPHARQFIIAHSHGGNIALYALRDRVREAVTGVVTLSTPFIQIRERELGSRAAWVKNIPPFVLCCAIGFVGSKSFVGDLAIGETALGWLTLIGTLLIAAVLYAMWIGVADALLRDLQLGESPGQGLLIVRTPGDEAGAALMLLPFASAVLHLVARVLMPLILLPARIWDLLDGLRERYRDSAPFGPIAAAGGYALGGVGLFLLLDGSSSVVAWVLIIAGLIGFLLLILSHVWFAVTILAALTVAIPIIVLDLIAAIAVLPFGLDFVPVALVANVTAEAAPEGTYTTFVAPTRRSASSEMPVRRRVELMHSRAYSDEFVCAHVREWLLARSGVEAVVSG